MSPRDAGKAPPTPSTPESPPPLFLDRDPTATPEQQLAAVHTFVRRCRAWAEAAIARRRVEGRSADDWELYLRFTDHTLAELESGTLDHWFTESS